MIFVVKMCMTLTFDLKNWLMINVNSLFERAYSCFFFITVTLIYLTQLINFRKSINIQSLTLKMKVKVKTEKNGTFRSSTENV